MIIINPKGFEDLIKDMDALALKQVPFATAKALTNTAQDVKIAHVAEMSRVFDRPTPFTLQSHYVKPATKNDLVSMVYLKDTGYTAQSGAPRSKAEAYLGPEIYGGKRTLKNFERMLINIGVLPNGMFIVPGAACPLDSYGNIPQSFIIQILSYFKAYKTAGFDSNRTMTKGKYKETRGHDYFVVNRVTGRFGSQHLKYGIYERTKALYRYTASGYGYGSSLKPIFMFVRNPQYSKRYPFYEVGNKIADMRFRENFIKAMKEALMSARRTGY